MRTIISAIDRLSGLTGALAGWLIVPLILITCWEVFARYALGAPTSWVYEMGTMTTGAYFILGCAYALREDAHIRIDVFSSRFPPKLQAALTVCGYLFLFLPLAWWLSWALFEYGVEALESGERSGQSSWNPLVWPVRFVVFAGFLMLALQATAECLKQVCLPAGCSAEQEGKNKDNDNPSPQNGGPSPQNNIM